MKTCGIAGGGGEQPGPLPLKGLPVDPVGEELDQWMAVVDQVS